MLVLGKQMTRARESLLLESAIRRANHYSELVDDLERKIFNFTLVSANVKESNSKARFYFISRHLALHPTTHTHTHTQTDTRGRATEEEQMVAQIAGDATCERRYNTSNEHE